MPHCQKHIPLMSGIRIAILALIMSETAASVVAINRETCTTNIDYHTSLIVSVMVVQRYMVRELEIYAS